MASFGFPRPALTGMDTARAGHVRPDSRNLQLLCWTVGMAGHSRPGSATGSLSLPLSEVLYCLQTWFPL